MNVNLYINTLKHLKPKQFIFQIYRRIYKRKVNIKHINPILRRYNFSFVKPIYKSQSLIKPNLFDFFGEQGDIGKIGWQGSEKEKLWRYNQHYFDDLNSLGFEKKIGWHTDLLSSWLHSNKKMDGVGWDPYPISIRVVNWIKWSFHTQKLSIDAKYSLFAQGLSLEKNIEYHILGNHIFSNAKALIFLGLFFKGDIPNRWLTRGLKILDCEIEAQILGDGAHFELSPMYHIIILEDILDLINISRMYNHHSTDTVVSNLERIVPKMLQWLSNMTFKDGNISLFNDAAINMAPKPSEIFQYSSRLEFEPIKKEDHRNLGMIHMQDSGYIAVNSGEKKIIIDIAKLGPDYLLAHGHADTLSFEMSYNENRIFVNSGTSCYEFNSRREFERSTKAHNTVELNHKNSSEVWSSFRVARRAYPSELKINKNRKEIIIKCSHDGYKRIKDGLNHTRKWIFRNKSMIIWDNISEGNLSAIARYILHSNVKVIRKKNNKFIIEDSSKNIIEFSVHKGKAELIKWQHTSEFGSLSDTSCIEVSFEGSESIIEIA